MVYSGYTPLLNFIKSLSWCLNYEVMTEQRFSNPDQSIVHPSERQNKIYVPADPFPRHTLAQEHTYTNKIKSKIECSHY